MATLDDFEIIDTTLRDPVGIEGPEPAEEKLETWLRSPHLEGMDAKTPKPKLNPEQQTAFKVRFLKPEYWGWFDAVAATFIVANQNDSAYAMTIPEAAELGVEPQRYTAWKFPDGHVEIVRPPVLEVIDVHVDFPEHLAAAFFPHEKGGTDWFLIREADHAMANVTRDVDPWDPESIHIDLTGAKIN